MDNNYIPKLLIIAPYPGLTKIIDEIKEQKKDVYIDVECGNLQEGVTLAMNHMNKNYDAIISRGGTLLEIQKAVNIPSIEIKFSTYDMIRILKMTDGLQTGIALIGYPSFTKCAQTVCQLVNRNVTIITIHNEAEAKKAVLRLKGTEIGILIGDQIVHTIAKENNVNCILFLSGPEAVSEAIEQAVDYCRFIHQNQVEVSKLHTIINNLDEKILAEDNNKEWSYCNYDKYSESEIHDYLSRKITGSEISDYFQSKDYLWAASLYAGPEFGKLCIANRLVPYVPKNDSKIKICDWLNMPQLYYYKYNGNDKKMVKLTEDVTAYGSSLLSVLLVGEKGVGKLHIAYAMHKESSKRKKLFAEIECECLKKDEFEGFLEDYKNILYGKEGGTVYFKGVDCLPLETQEAVIDYIGNSMVKKNIRLIFSSSIPIEPLVESKLIQRRLGSILTELILTVPSLRERPGCIEGIADMMLHEYNMAYGKQVIGFDSTAQKMLVEYPWPGNINQLKRVISSVLLKCNSYHITANDLKVELEQEKRLADYSLQEDNILEIKPNQTLYQINRNIIQKILKEENMNHTKTAQRLGIGRSTLWRILKTEE